MRSVWIQETIELRPRPRGFHLVTSEIVDAVPDLGRIEVGLANVFMQHTSASLTLNENASPDVRRDFSAWFDRAVPDGADYFAHTLEGPDDMPAHIKTSLTGSSLTIPVSNGSHRRWGRGRAFTYASTATTAGRAAWCSRRPARSGSRAFGTSCECANMCSCAGTT
jgi:secondary thiamine-phosphate synthase enzyme